MIERTAIRGKIDGFYETGVPAQTLQAGDAATAEIKVNTDRLDGLGGSSIALIYFHSITLSLSCTNPCGLTSNVRTSEDFCH